MIDTAPMNAALVADTTVEPLTDADLVCLSVLTSNRFDDPAAFLEHLATISHTYWQAITPYKEAAARALAEHRVVQARADLPVFEVTAYGRQRIAATVPLWPQALPAPITPLEEELPPPEDVS